MTTLTELDVRDHPSAPFGSWAIGDDVLIRLHEPHITYEGRHPITAWRDVPLTGERTIPDPSRRPQIRVTPLDMLDLSGVIGLAEDRAYDNTLIGLLPKDYRPQVPRTLIAPSDSGRLLYVEATPEGQLLLRVPGRSRVRASVLSLDGPTCRLDAPHGQ
ncbi:hypothetical protein [Streptomyces luteolus]|uniref:Uncharacterized protein n=1 Tax=Streptomyces luteolus TaxID=3043615 RepID=A0ABT6T4F8_9ACTN|nr:hypothetical protein [Streptomyces sp. B-S-A12]MDI3421752.1 hypothetical protein [Streptomyces sp. B-S-A12]